MNAKIKFFFKVEDRVDPIAVIHVHWLDVVWLDHIIVDLGCFTNNLCLLTSVLVNEVV